MEAMPFYPFSTCLLGSQPPRLPSQPSLAWPPLLEASRGTPNVRGLNLESFWFGIQALGMSSAKKFIIFEPFWALVQIMWVPLGEEAGSSCDRIERGPNSGGMHFFGHF